MKKNIEFSNLDKIFFPKSGITKGDLLEYYAAIAPHFVALSHDRLTMLQRFPNGIDQEWFYQKEASEYFPAWIKRGTIALKDRSKQHLVVVNDAESLVYLANQATITFHTWMSSYKKPNYPNKIVFDLDPSRKNDLKNLRFAAKKIKEILQQHGLKSFVMTTGSRGYHIVAPIKPTHTFDEVHAFTKKIAEDLAEKYPKILTVALNKAKRKGRIFVDHLRNEYGATSVAPYAVRALEGAPVATPIAWNELGRVKPQQFTIKNILRRCARKKDPWKDFDKSAKTLHIKK